MSKHLPRFSAGRLIFGITAIIVVYFLARGVTNYVQNEQLNSEEARLQAEIDDYASRYDRLAALERYLQSDEYIETIAREQLGLVMAGETGFVAISTQPTATPAADAGPDLWWEVLIR